MKTIVCLARSIKPVHRSEFFGVRRVVQSSLALLFLASVSTLKANPTGGSVAGGSASISGTGTSSVTINQSSKVAIINWNSFSINQGELTTFLQPNSSSATLNRVTGGGISSINGTLNANGQVFLINGNGILIGKSGAVNTAGFTASTQDIQNSDFLLGKYQFKGSSNNGVQNLGSVNALGGDIYLIGHTVDNEGSLTASSGTVGLAAGNNVLIKQGGNEHVFVNPSNVSQSVNGTAVNNAGSISATAAELRAANGNMYALAINNGGTIRATTINKQGGHIFLTSDKGTIVNTGTIDASATADKGVAGQITLKTGTTGTVVNHGTVLAHGGIGGTGGTVDLSGGNLDFTGGVDLSTVGGTTGSLLLDPSSITVINDPNANGTVTVTGSTTTYTPAPNFVGSELYTQVLEAQLNFANVIVDGINNVTIADAVSWDSPATLTLQTSAKTGGRIIINAPITGKYDQTNYTNYYDNYVLSFPNTVLLPGSYATLNINAVGNGFVTTGVNGTIDVDNFTLQNGIWQQIVSTVPASVKSPGLINGVLPAFSASNDFRLLNTSTFERFAGGDGKPIAANKPADSPYQVVDIFGLQGIGSPSDTLLGNSFILNNDINFDDGANVTYSTVNWNGGGTVYAGAGWVPIGEGGKTVKPFTGTFDGANHIIVGYYLYRPDDNLVGMFGQVSGTVKNVSLDVIGNQGSGIGGLLVGQLMSKGVIENSNVGHIPNVDEPGLPANPSNGLTDNQSSLAANKLGVSCAAGGLVGETLAGSSIIDCNSNVFYELLGGNGGLIGLGGLVGINYGTITNSSSSGGASTAVNVTATTVIGASSKDFKVNSISLGGLVGANYGAINGGESSGTITTETQNQQTPVAASILDGPGNFYLGGFVGTNYGTINGTVPVTTIVAGHRVTTVYQYQSFTTDQVLGPIGGNVNGGTGSYYIGGFAGANYGKISNAFSAPVITGVVDTLGNPLTQGGLVEGLGNLNGPDAGSAGALGNYVIGGFAGGNFGSIANSGTEDTVYSNSTLAGIANVTSVKKGVSVTVPATVNIKTPLALDSVLVGGFVGLNGTGSSITGSFSDYNFKTINFHLDPTSLIVPAGATPGQTFTLESFSSPDLVSSDGTITGGNGFYIIGGLVGANYGTVGTSYSTGNIQATGTTTQSNSFYVGGLAGINSGNITNAYALGNVTSLTMSSGNQTGVVGGLVAQMFSGNITNTYSLGTVTGGITRGGLVGVISSGKVSGSFWDLDANSGLTYSAGGTGALGESEANLFTDNNGVPPDYTTSVYGKAKWDFKNIWTVGSTPETPTLKNIP